MILSNVEIHRALDDGDIVITPEPSPRFSTLSQPDSPFGTTSVDLRLSSELSIPDPGAPFTFDLRKGGLAPFLAKISKPATIGNTGLLSNEISSCSAELKNTSTFQLGKVDSASLRAWKVRAPVLDVGCSCTSQLPPCTQASMEPSRSRSSTSARTRSRCSPVCRSAS